MSIKKKFNIDQTKHYWYIITAVRGKEELVADSLRKKIHAYGFDELVDDIKIIKQTKISYQWYTNEDSPKRMVNTDKIKWETIESNGVIKYRKTKTEEVNKFPGYIFINMHIVDELWFLIRNTKDVTGLVGSSGHNSKPIPISEYEINNLFNTTDEEILNEDSMPTTINQPIKEIVDCKFNIGDFVHILSMDMYGNVTSIDLSKATCTIQTEIFGNKQDISNISFDDVELADNEN